MVESENSTLCRALSKTLMKQLRLERDGYSNIIFISRYSVIRLSRLVWDQEAVGSNPAISTKWRRPVHGQNVYKIVEGDKRGESRTLTRCHRGRMVQTVNLVSKIQRRFESYRVSLIFSNILCIYY
jgi:hypothetical protein